MIYKGEGISIARDGMRYGFEDWLVFSEMEDDYPFVYTVSSRIAVPEIITLKRYNKLPQREVKYSRQTIFQRDNYTCAYCGGDFQRSDLTIDHIDPKSKGGRSSWKNTISSCRKCNARKADKTLKQANMALLFKPKKPKWISPLAHIRRDHPCKSWKPYLDYARTE